MDHCVISASAFHKHADRYREKYMGLTLYDDSYRGSAMSKKHHYQSEGKNEKGNHKKAKTNFTNLHEIGAVGEVAVTKLQTSKKTSNPELQRRQSG